VGHTKSKRSWENSYVICPDYGCWLWQFGLNEAGYGTWHEKNYGAKRYAHIVSWEKHRGAVPKGLHLDHFLTRFGCPKNCINPDHLEPVTQRVNNIRKWQDIKYLKEKRKNMNLGPRCEMMLENRMQCPNTAEENSIYCMLHNKLNAALAAKEVSTPAVKKDTDAK
jgi:hypothetical protein